MFSNYVDFLYFGRIDFSWLFWLIDFIIELYIYIYIIDLLFITIWYYGKTKEYNWIIRLTFMISDTPMVFFL